MAPTAKRFVSWAAVSSLPQAKKVSLEDQLAVNRVHAEKWGGIVTAELVVPGESRSIVLFEDACRKIQAYAQLQRLIQERAFDVLIFLDRSRLGRKASLSMAVVELCHSAGIATYETDNPPPSLDALQTTYDDMLLGAIKSVGAQREVQKIQERHLMGMIGRIKRGELPAGPMFGYTQRYDPVTGSRSLEIDPPRAEAVRQMFAMYLNGAGSTVIADYLNKCGIASPTGKTWEPIQVRSVLFRAWRYAGFSEVNRRSRSRPYVKAKGVWPAIISEETAEQVYDERAKRMERKRVPDTPYLLSGIVVCRRCSRTMKVATTVRRRKTARIQMQLRCSNPHEHAFISYPRVYAALEATFEYMAHVDDVDALIGEDEDPTTEWREQIERQQAALAAVRAAQLRADDAFVGGMMDSERYGRQVNKFNAQIQAHTAEIARLEQLIEDEKERGTRRQRIEEVKQAGVAMLHHEDSAAANAWLSRHVRIWVENHAVTDIEFI